jgi:hypothetical protein
MIKEHINERYRPGGLIELAFRQPALFAIAVGEGQQPY